MHIALQGALIGIALGVFLVVFEYYAVKRAVEERATLRQKKPEFEPTDRKRIQTVLNFSFFIPPAFALAAWLIWG
jgi:hypothetical protein